MAATGPPREAAPTSSIVRVFIAFRLSLRVRLRK